MVGFFSKFLKTQREDSERPAGLERTALHSRVPPGRSGPNYTNEIRPNVRGNGRRLGPYGGRGALRLAFTVTSVPRGFNQASSRWAARSSQRVAPDPAHRHIRGERVPLLARARWRWGVRVG